MDMKILFQQGSFVGEENEPEDSFVRPVSVKDQERRGCLEDSSVLRG